MGNTNESPANKSFITIPDNIIYTEEGIRFCRDLTNAQVKIWTTEGLKDAFIERGEDKSIYRITFMDGSKIDCVDDDIFTTNKGEIKVEDLEIGMKIMKYTSKMTFNCLRSPSVYSNGSVSSLRKSKFNFNQKSSYDAGITHGKKELNSVDCANSKSLKYRSFLDTIIENNYNIEEFISGWRDGQKGVITGSLQSLLMLQLIMKCIGQHVKVVDNGVRYKLEPDNTVFQQISSIQMIGSNSTFRIYIDKSHIPINNSSLVVY
jgi:hypothetical protein